MICSQGIDPSIVILLSNESVDESKSVSDHLVNWSMVDSVGKVKGSHINDFNSLF